MPMLSRVADTLLWMSRYLERAEHAARLLDLQLHTMLEAPGSAEPRWQRILDSLYVPMPKGEADAYALTRLLTFAAANPNSIAVCISGARENARNVREQISSEMWEHLNRLSMQVRQANLDHLWESEPHSFFRAVKEGIHTFQGITDSTMNHGEGWHFIQAGRYIERTSAIARLLDIHFTSFADVPIDQTVREHFLDWIGLLKSCTAFEAYCKVYTADLRPARIVEFLLLNHEFPHAVRFSANCLHSALIALEQTTESKRARQPSRLAGRLRAVLDYGQVDEVMRTGFHQYLRDVEAQCEGVHQAIHQAYIEYPIHDILS